ncbi:hypothetical protein [Archaeoglobus neptunius]|uniref:hypothetical protein n=1 Tax=Archaeoglobus neptunius TaxID=2798580 RepID=UPI001926DB05|nr:hypothetical protein [Archaeoglobus neptunius]
MKQVKFCDGVRKYTLTAYDGGVCIATECTFSGSHSEIFLPKAHLKEVTRFLTDATLATKLKTHYENAEKDAPRSGEVFPEVITAHDSLHGVSFETFDDLELAKTFADCLKKSLSEREVEIYTQVDDDRGDRVYVRGLQWVNRTGVYAVVWR